MKIENAKAADFDAMLLLAREVEYLFGSMVDDLSFRTGLRKSISDSEVFCLREKSGSQDGNVRGGIIVSKQENTIAWFVVSQSCRGLGYGAALLRFAIDRLDKHNDITVQTFDDSVPEGLAARNAYKSVGFIEQEKSSLNLAGLPTAIMVLPGNQLM